MSNENDRSARVTMPTIASWPVDADGNPMAIVCGAASDLIPTVQYGNILIGPVAIMRPVPNGTDDEVAASARAVQKITEHVVATERRIIDYALDPSTKIQKPSEANGWVGVAPPPAPAPPAPAPPATADAPGATPSPAPGEPGWAPTPDIGRV